MAYMPSTLMSPIILFILVATFGFFISQMIGKIILIDF